ncbi:MAG: dephospho-CoA kinase [Bacteroidales bacterium]|nr:dephospho-CoA kinase [Bacteroidales bacterium]
MALTGGMGSGKTTVLQCFEELGVPCFCADSVAADYYNDKTFCQKLRGIFGDGIFAADGTPDKKAIAAVVFADKKQLQRLNALVHPMVMHDFEIWYGKHSAQPYVLFESAIVFESNLQGFFDKIICVCAPLDLRIRRILRRDNTSEELARTRIAHQIDDEERKQRSNYIINNCYGPKRRQKTVLNIHNKLLKLTK